MASRCFRKARKGDVTSRRHFNNMDDSRSAKVDGGHRMTLCRKLMICAELIGVEAAINFQQIYTIPVLQILGMPVSLSYILALVSGPSAILLLPLLGWLVDRGGNPQNRKFASIVLSASVQVLGVSCLLCANALHLSYLRDYETNNSTGEPGTNVSVESFGMNGSWFGLSTNLTADSVGANTDTRNGSSGSSSVGSLTVPFKAGLGMLGFIFMDIGFDLSTCFVRAFMVSCCPRAEHTSLIVLGVMMGAIGGVTNAVLGLVDFTSLLGLTSIEGAKVTIQTSVQGLIIIVIVITGLLFTFCTGRKQLLELQDNNSQITSPQSNEIGKESNPGKFHENGTSTCNENSSPSHEENSGKMNSVVDVLDSSLCSFGENSILVDPSMAVVVVNPPSQTEEDPLLEDSLHEKGENGDLLISRPVRSYRAIESASQTHEETSYVETSVKDVRGSHPEEGVRGRLPCLKNPKVRIFFVFLATFFAADALLMATAAMSDFLGKGVYGGDPAADPGSQSSVSYQEGIKMASWVLMVYFVTYLVASIAHPSILRFLGFRVEFTLLQTLFAIIGLVTALTLRLEAVFVLSVVAGMTRTCYYTMPYAVTNDIAQTIVSTSNGRSPVTLALSLVAASPSLGYFVLFTWTGAVEELTGDISAPLWLGSAAGFLAVIAFLFVGRV